MRCLLSASPVGAVQVSHSAAAPPAALLQDLGTNVVFSDLGTMKNGNELYEAVNVTPDDAQLNDVQLWETNGTVAGTALLHDFGAGWGVAHLVTTANDNALLSVANSSTKDVQLWGSNGTAAGTALLHDFGTVVDQFSLPGVTDLGTAGNGNSLIEAVSATTGDVQLWGTNGTAVGTALLHDFGTGFVDQYGDVGLGNGGTVGKGNSLIQAVNFTTGDVQWWGTNGTAGGTALLHDFGMGFIDAFGQAEITVFGTAANGRALLEAVDSSTGDVQLWGTNGTAGGTALLHDFGTEVVGQFGQVGFTDLGTAGNGNSLIEAVSSGTGDVQLWGTNGMAAGTVLLRDFGTGFIDMFGQAEVTVLGTAGNGHTLIEAANPATNDVQLWGSDGTTAGTALLHDFGPGLVDQFGDVGLTQVGTVGNGNSLISTTNLTTGDTQLWVSNGAAAGTALLQDFGVGSPVVGEVAIAVNGNALLEVLSLATRDVQFWVSDGTAAGTALVQDIGAGGLVEEVGLAANGGLLLNVFVATADDWQLRVSDGTVSGTVLLADFGNGSSRPILLGTTSNGQAIILASTTSGTQLWGSNGTVSGTSLLQNLGSEYLALAAQVMSNGNVVIGTKNFTAGDVKLWGTDGTAAGTSLLLDFGAGVGAGSNVVYSTTVNGSLLLQMGGATLADASQLWVTDGTTAGTALLHDFGTDTVFSFEMGMVNGTAILQVTNLSTNDVQWWGSNGTVAGTQLLYDFGTADPVGDFEPIGLGMASNGDLLFGMWNLATNDVQLLRTNGTAAGTSLVEDFGALLVENFGATVAIENFGSTRNGHVLIEVVTDTGEPQLWSVA